MALTEVTTNNRLRFLDNGPYLLIRELGTPQLNTCYQCQVTNALLHEMETSPTTYTLVNNIGNEFRIYKRLILIGPYILSRTILHIICSTILHGVNEFSALYRRVTRKH